MSWLFESLHENVKLGLKGKVVYKKKTAFQDLKILKNPRFGNVLILDGVIQTTTKDEFIYHEMMTHPVLLAHPNPKKVLIIGAGDGGILREVVKHPVKQATMVEIDGDVIDLSKKYLPSISKGSFKNKKVRVIIDDGAKFVAQTKEKFDVAIIDSPDPIGPAKILFSRKFYKNIYKVLSKQGIMIRQSGSSMLQSDELKENYRILKSIFPRVSVQIAGIPTYICGLFNFLIASKSIDPHRVSRKKVITRFRKLRLKTDYYNPEVHFASLALPSYIRRMR